MSDCVCLGGYYGDMPTVYTEAKVKSRKPHKCYECEREIPKGAVYERVSGLWDGEWSTYTFCAECSEIGLAFSCGEGRTFGILWEDIHNYIFPDLGGDCFDKLETAAAKQFLRDKWMQWRGLEQS